MLIEVTAELSNSFPTILPGLYREKKRTYTINRSNTSLSLTFPLFFFVCYFFILFYFTVLVLAHRNHSRKMCVAFYLSCACMCAKQIYCDRRGVFFVHFFSLVQWLFLAVRAIPIYRYTCVFSTVNNRERKILIRKSCVAIYICMLSKVLIKSKRAECVDWMVFFLCFLGVWH